MDRPGWRCAYCRGRYFVLNYFGPRCYCCGMINPKGDKMPTNELWTAERLEERLREIRQKADELIREEFRAGYTQLPEIGGQAASLYQFIYISQNALGNAGDE